MAGSKGKEFRGREKERKTIERSRLKNETEKKGSFMENRTGLNRKDIKRDCKQGRRSADRKPVSAASVLAALTSFLMVISGFCAVCVQAGAAEPKTEVIKTTSEEEFASESSILVKENQGTISIKTNEVEEYSSGRLIVSVKNGEEVNLTSYGASKMVQSTFGTNILQFSSGEAAKNAAKKIRGLSGVSYVEADDMSMDIGDTEVEEILFEKDAESDSASGKTAVTDTDEYNLKNNPATLGTTGGNATGYDIESAGQDIAYDSSVRIGEVSTSASYMSWGVEYIKAHNYAAYIRPLTKRSIKVAVVDSGVASHTRLKGRLLSGIDLVDNDKNAADYNGHGTHVAGTIVDCTPGLKVYILPVRVMNSSGMGSPSAVGNGIRYAANAGAKVINLSLGGRTRYKYIEDCVAYAHRKGATVVVASGNENENVRYSCLAHLSTPIVVGAINDNNTRAGFSNYGSTVDVAAPGVDIISCWLDDAYAIASGTSMAAPHVSAVAAMHRLMRPNYSADQIHRIVRYYVKDIGKKGWDNYFGTGIPYLTKAISPNKVTLNRTTATLQVKKTLTLKATISPACSGLKNKLTWYTSNKAVVTVSGGKLTARKKGTATITVKTGNGKKATCKVTVTD